MSRAVCSVPEEDLGTNACQRKGFYNLLCGDHCASLTPISAWLTVSSTKGSFTLENWERIMEGSNFFHRYKHSLLSLNGKNVTKIVDAKHLLKN